MTSDRGRVLVVDDEPQLLRALRINLRARGFEVTTAANGASALAAAATGNPDVIVLDLGLPDMDGVTVLHGLRGWSTVPVIVLSARTDAADKVTALDAGADDYVTKPFSVDELLARIRALTRRAPQEEALPSVRLGNITIDLAARSVTKESPAGRRQIRLTPTEWQVIEILIRHTGKLVTRQPLLTSIWGTERAEDTGYLRLYISQLRKKIETDPSNPTHIITEPGMGYRLENVE